MLVLLEEVFSWFEAAGKMFHGEIDVTHFNTTKIR